MCRDTDEEESVSSMLSELHYKKKKIIAQQTYIL